MGHIRWRESMAIDRGLIDDDHRHLIEIVNRFEDHLLRGQGDVAVAIDILHALKFYADTHFAREERLQRLIDYPEVRLHREDHRRLAATLDQMIAKTGSLAQARSADVVQELRTLLRHWLLDHIIKLDLRMKPHAHLMRGHAAGLPVLKEVARRGVAVTP
jgi:hemerythrin-like metal-binding protein